MVARIMRDLRPLYRPFFFSLILLSSLSCGKDDTTGPQDSLAGTWDFIGFSDDGIEAETTGTWVFRLDGTFSANGTVTYPGEPTDDVDVDGSWEVSGNTVLLTIDQASSTWTTEFTGDVAVLTSTANPGTTATLRRR